MSIFDRVSDDIKEAMKAKDKVKLEALRNIKKSLFKQLHENHKHSLENTNYYLGSKHIRNFSLFTFKELEQCFNLGIKEAQNHFLDIL